MPLYTTVDQVKSMFRRLKVAADTGTESTNTVITTEEMEQFIDDAEAEINAKLNRYYETPIVPGTSPESAKILATIAKYKVAFVVKGILELTSEKSDLKQEVIGDLDKKAMKMLDELLPWFNRFGGKSDTGGRWEEPITPLPDAVVKATHPYTESLFSSHVTSTVKPTFEKGGKNW